ncbi:MAG: methyltransferase [Betaproteobacteria bacterium]
MPTRTQPRDGERLTWPSAAAPAAEATSWRERWQQFVEDLVVRPGFRRWASGFWLTRPLVRRRAGELFDLVAGFVYTQVLLACVRLDLFNQLAAGPDSAARLAQRLGLPLRSMQRLLDAAVSLRLLQRRSGGRYGLGALGAPMVGNAALAAMVEHHATLYADLRDPVALLRDEGAGSAMAAYWPYASYPERQGRADGAAPALPARQVAEYSALMTASQPMVIEELLDAYPLARHRVLLDVGGGEGRFVAAALAAAPRLRAMLFDLPPVADLATARLGAQGLGGRVAVHGGSFFDDPLPEGADVATLVRVLFDHDDAHALAILRAVARALPPGGTLLVAEPMAEAPGARTMGDAYFGFYLLAMGRGQPRSAQALTALLQQAGFTDVRALRTRMPLQAGVLVARRASGGPSGGVLPNGPALTDAQ